MALEKAARVTSPVAHVSSTATDVLTGAGIVLSFFVGPEAGVLARIIAGVALTGRANVVGHAIDSYLMGEDASEKIAEGVPHVFVDEPKYQAANTSSRTLTDEHQESPRTGSKTVTIEKHAFSRRADVTKCDGVIVDGSQHVFVGGEPSDAPSEMGQRVGWLTSKFELVSTIVGLAQAPTSIWEGVQYGAGVVGMVHENKVSEAIGVAGAIKP